MITQIKYTIISMPTIVEPTGVPASIDIMMPKAAQIIDNIAELMTTLVIW